jgi:hypothetical protein
MTYRDPRKVLEDIFDEEFGLRLTSSVIKPVHVANGLARALLGRTYDATALVRTLRRYVRNQRLGIDEERNPNAEILRDYGSAFDAIDGLEPDSQRLTRLRSLLFDVLGADDAVFAQPDKSSFTLSNERFVTPDPSDQRMGMFLARLLMAGSSDRTDAADTIRDLLLSENDPWTVLALPLLEFGTVREHAEGAETVTLAAKADHLFVTVDGALASPTLRRLREAYDRLARFERLSGSKLNSLRRLMLFGCFVVHVHCISRWSEREPEAPRPPILLDMFDGAVKSVRDASRATVRAGGDAIEGLIRMRFQEHVLADYGANDLEIRQVLEGEIGQAPDSAEAKQRILHSYENYLEGGADPAEALTSALVEDAFGKLRERPIGSLIELGRRAGFLTPWAVAGRGGKLRKRYTATPEFLEALIAATIEPNDPLEFPEFLKRLRDDFGIVVGQPQDDSVIRQNNLQGRQFGPPTSTNEEDLRENVEQMRRLVVETGYAKAYADGRTIVTTRLQGARPTP